MGESLIPTMSLRYVNRFAPAPHLGENIVKAKKTLQQRFDKPGGGHVWHDVEFIEDDPEPESPEPILVPCCNCGKQVDTREEADGGGPHGAQFSDGDWVCSFECWEVSK